MLGQTCAGSSGVGKAGHAAADAAALDPLCHRRGGLPEPPCRALHGTAALLSPAWPHLHSDVGARRGQARQAVNAQVQDLLRVCHASGSLGSPTLPAGAATSGAGLARRPGMQWSVSYGAYRCPGLALARTR